MNLSLSNNLINPLSQWLTSSNHNNPHVFWVGHWVTCGWRPQGPGGGLGPSDGGVLLLGQLRAHLWDLEDLGVPSRCCLRMLFISGEPGLFAIASCITSHDEPCSISGLIPRAPLRISVLPKWSTALKATTATAPRIAKSGEARNWQWW